MQSLWIRIPLIVAITIACNVDRPLPPPQNPVSVSLLCGGGAERAKCEEQGLVCHIAIGGGTCADACTDDAWCGGLVEGFVCHAALGGVCAPPCDISGNDKVCGALGANSCGADSRCEPVPSPTATFVRTFNGTPGTVDLQSDGLPGNAGVPSGGVSSLVATVAGLHNFKIVLPDGTVAAEQPFDLVTGRRYLFVAYNDGDKVKLKALEDKPFAPPTAGSASIRYVNLDRSTYDVRIGTENTPLFSNAAGGSVSDARSVVAGPEQFLVGQSPGLPTHTYLNATIAAGKGYVLITWPNPREALPQTVLLDADTGDVRALPSGIRLINASADDSLTLFVDGVEVTTLQSAGFSASPAEGYFLSGATTTHAIEVVHAGVSVFTTMSTFAPGARYSVICAGTFSLSDAAHLRCQLANDVPAPLPDAGKTMVRVLHVVRGKITLPLASGTVAGVSLVVAPLSYGVLGDAAVADMASAPATFDAQFQSDLPVTATSPPVLDAVGLTFLLVDDGAGVGVVTIDSLGRTTILK